MSGVQHPLPDGVYADFSYSCECGATVQVRDSVRRPHECQSKLREWERCPKRHAGEVQHLLDCPPDEPFPYVPGAVVKYRGKMGLSWLAWAGHDDNYNEVWYCQRRDSVTPGAPRAVTHADLLEEIGIIEGVFP